jgi:hypothetical protein
MVSTILRSGAFRFFFFSREEPRMVCSSRPARRTLAGALDKFAGFSQDFMAKGRGENIESERADM